VHARLGICLYLAISGLSACSAEPVAEPTSAPKAIEPAATAQVDHRHELDVDWIEFPENEIYRASVAILRGRVIAQRFGMHRTHPVNPSAGDDYAELPLTISTFNVEKRLFAGHDDAARGASVEIVQLGGRYADGCAIEPNGQRLLRLNDEAIVYLRAADMVPHDVVERSGFYAVIGGQQGLIPIRDGVAAPIAATPFERYARRPIPELASEIESIAAVRGAK
jgi:hypothetical protein